MKILQLCALLTTALTTITPIVRAQTQPPVEKEKVAFRLDSTLPYQEVRIPFDLEQSGAVLIEANIGGETNYWLLDTGSPLPIGNATVLSSARPAKGGFIIGDATGQRAEVEMVTLPKFSVGGFHIFNASFGRVKGKKTNHGKSASLHSLPRINCLIFSNNVLTIDYGKKELVVRSPLYEPTRNLRSDSITLPLGRKDFDEGWPVTEIYVGGRKMRMVVDTGWGVSSIGLTESSFSSLLKGQKEGHEPKINDTNVTSPVSGEQSTLKVTSPLNIGFSQSADAFRLPAYIVPGAFGRNVDGCFGYSVLRRYRVTFDFPRERIIFEPAALQNPREEINAGPPCPPSPGYYWKYVKNSGWVEIPLHDSLPTGVE